MTDWFHREAEGDKRPMAGLPGFVEAEILGQEDHVAGAWPTTPTSPPPVFCQCDSHRWVGRRFMMKSNPRLSPQANPFLRYIL
jgi:hypothetical protein